MNYDEKTKTILIENCHECPFLITRTKYIWSGWEGHCALYDIVADELINFEIENEEYIWHKCPLKKHPFTFIGCEEQIGKTKRRKTKNE